jgi:hypothetical protein
MLEHATGDRLAMLEVLLADALRTSNWRHPMGHHPHDPKPPGKKHHDADGNPATHPADKPPVDPDPPHTLPDPPADPPAAPDDDDPEEDDEDEDDEVD